MAQYLHIENVVSAVFKSFCNGNVRQDFCRNENTQSVQIRRIFRLIAVSSLSKGEANEHLRFREVLLSLAFHDMRSEANVFLKPDTFSMAMPYIKHNLCKHN